MCIEPDNKLEVNKICAKRGETIRICDNVCIDPDNKLEVNKICGKEDSYGQVSPVIICGDLCVEGKIKGAFEFPEFPECIENLSVKTFASCDEYGAIDVLSDVCIDNEKKLLVNKICSKDGERVPVTICGDLCVEGKIEATSTITGSVVKPSDGRIKTDCELIPASESLEKVLALTPQTFMFAPEVGLSDQRQRGFIAQEVQEVLPELVTVQETKMVGGSKLDNFLSLDYSAFVVDLVGALQASHQHIESLQECQEQADRVQDDLLAQLALLKQQVTDLASAQA